MDAPDQNGVIPARVNGLAAAFEDRQCFSQRRRPELRGEKRDLVEPMGAGLRKPCGDLAMGRIKDTDCEPVGFCKSL